MHRGRAAIVPVLAMLVMLGIGLALAARLAGDGMSAALVFAILWVLGAGVLFLRAVLRMIRVTGSDHDGQDGS
ncbi:hypothetical protein [Oceanomicrobium pacificus]|uniref:Uncharacterized protein n=1 Tax=Oceanomicrobium pacificus TaxID=2692916 RepID=A0A6B0TRM1_9RHOB|nr:hypothetical protein [Oceanomicrobium pacificus]MXU65359.1 hypothetical protein [Oceanomicrobium pacificus]